MMLNYWICDSRRRGDGLASCREDGQKGCLSVANKGSIIGIRPIAYCLYFGPPFSSTSCTRRNASGASRAEETRLSRSAQSAEEKVEIEVQIVLEPTPW